VQYFFLAHPEQHTVALVKCKSVINIILSQDLFVF
jgi:hypothetical protein